MPENASCSELFGVLERTYQLLEAAVAIWKDPVRSATTGNITLSKPQTIDGVALIVGDRVLVKNQADATQNGLWTVESDNWSRTSDASTTIEPEMAVRVSEGTVNARTAWVLTTTDLINLGSTALTYEPIVGFSRVLPGTTPTAEFNVLTFGAIPDAEVTSGFKAGTNGTVLAADNLRAFNLAVAAIEATGAPGRLRIPAGTYYLSDRWQINAAVPIEIAGDEGDFFGFNRPTNLVWPRFNFISGAVTKVACIHIATPAGSIVRDINIWQPTADQVLPWTVQKNRAGSFTFNTNVIPDDGSFGVVYHCTAPSPGIIPGDTHTPFPTQMDILTVFKEEDLIFVPFIVDSRNPEDKVWRYRCMGGSGNQRTDSSRSLLPFTGQAEPFIVGAHYDINSPPLRPSDSNWTGFYFIVISGSGTVNTEPDWSLAHGVNELITQDGVTFKNNGLIWPRSSGLTTTITDTATGGTTSWVLDDTSGIFHDTNGGGTPIDWEVQAPIAGVLFESSTKLQQVNIFGISGDGVRGIGATGTPGDAWRAEDLIVSNCANDGFTITGGDANIGHAKGVQVIGAGRGYIWDLSFLGNTYETCQITPQDFSHPGRFGYRCTELNANTSFNGCYAEKGSPPSWFLGPIGLNGRQGTWTFFHDESISQVWDRHGRTVASHQISVGPPGKTWRPREVVFPLEYRRPSTSNGKRYLVAAVDTLGLTTTKAIEPTEAFNRNKSTGAIFVEGNVTIVSSANTTPVEVTTSQNHGFVTGQSVVISGHTGNPINGSFSVTVTAANKFTLDGSVAGGSGTGGAVTDNGTNSVTYQCEGSESATIIIGDDVNPERVLEIDTSDVLDQFRAPARLMLMGNCPADGQIGWTTGGIPSNCFLGFDLTKLVPIFPQPIYVGPARRLWSWSNSPSAPAADVLPSSPNQEGDIVWNAGDGIKPPPNGYAGFYCTRTGTATDDPGTWTKFAKLYDQSQELFDQPRLRWAGGTDSNGGTAPNTDAVRDGVRTMDATTTTAHTIITSANGTLYKVTATVAGKRTDVLGDFATFVIKGNYLNNAGVLSADLGTPFVVEGTPTDGNHATAGAMTWTATLDTSGTTIRVRVTGEVGKAIHWSIVREQVEAV